VRSVIHFTRNYANPGQMSKLNADIRAAAGGSVLVTVDHEGGRVQRFRGEGFPDQPSGRELGEAGVEAARAAGLAAAHDLRRVGFTMNLAPVLDGDSNPANPVIGARAFSSDPVHAAACAVAYAQGLRAGGVHACGKHFPGHGDTNVDSHLDLPRLPHAMERLESVELVPFRAAAQAGIEAIMTAHVLFEALDPTVPATLSRTVVTGLLRERLGFDGLVITDDFEMQAIADRFEPGEAAVRAVEAGCDLVLVCHTPARQRRVIQALAEAMRSGRLTRERVDTSRKRLAKILDSR
ncbi:MAG: beta-N-acetylhexosaminidase, partial [Planctomycetota bacterium]